MKTKLLAIALLAGGSMFAQSRFSVGVHIGGYGPGYYAPAPPVYAVRPPCPGPDYLWTDGYWVQDYGRRAWHDGYWARRSYGYAPRYDERVYEGYGRGYNRGNEQYRGSYGQRGYDRNNREDNRGRYDRGRGNGYENGFRR